MKKYAVLLILLLMLVGAGCADKGGGTSVNIEVSTAIDPANGAANIPLGGLSVLHDGMIYYVAEGENGGETLCSMDEEGSNEALLYTPASNLDQLSCLSTDGSAVYFLETIFDPQWLGIREVRIRKLNLLGGEVTTLLVSDIVTNCLTYHNGNLYYTVGRDMTEEGPYWTEEDYGGDYYLMRLALDGSGVPGNADGCNAEENLGVFPAKCFVIQSDRIWCAPGLWSETVASWDPEGQDKQIHYAPAGDNAMSVYALHGGLAYIHEYGHEEPGQNYVVDLNSGEKKKIANDIGGTCNPIGSTFYFLTTTQAEIVSSPDLEITNSGAGTNLASSGDLDAVPASELPASHSDLKIEGMDSIIVTPAASTVYVYQQKENGDLEKVTAFERPGKDTYSEDLGSFSGKWRFYSIGEAGNGRTLQKEMLN